MVERAPAGSGDGDGTAVAFVGEAASSEWSFNLYRDIRQLDGSVFSEGRANGNL